METRGVAGQSEGKAAGRPVWVIELVWGGQCIDKGEGSVPKPCKEAV